jgi:hypothetical protein
MRFLKNAGKWDCLFSQFAYMSESKKIGRPTLYRDDYPEKVKDVCLLGGTDKQIAEFFNVDPDTVYNWKKAHPEFDESIKLTKLKADVEVARGLYGRAKAGEAVAAIFWLKNRQPSAWRDKQESEAHVTHQVVNIDLSLFTDEELQQYNELNSKALRAAQQKKLESEK